MPLPPSLHVGIQALDNIVKSQSSPYATAIAGLCRVLVDAVVETAENRQKTAHLGERILEICTVCAQAFNKNAHKDQEKLAFYAGQLISSLEGVYRALAARSSRSRFRRLIMRSSDTISLKAAQEDLEQCFSLLVLRLNLENVDRSQAVATSTSFHLRDLESALARSQRDQLDAIKHHANEKLSEHDLPPMPRVFRGREAEVAYIVKMLSTEAPSYIAILGAGGIGKTDLALSVLHHPTISELCPSHKYFISCESFLEPADLIVGVAQYFGLSEKTLIQSLRQFSESLDNDLGRLILVLDNFETPWEAETKRKATETFLSQLSTIPKLSLIVTLRGAERPLGIAWTRPFLPPLEVLDLTSAKAAFMDISDADENTEGLDELLNLVDRVPLAVSLMATQAQYLPCSMLLQQWQRRRTLMLSRGQTGRLSSLSVSIEVSLKSERFTACPEALILLRVLSLLPDGVEESELASLVPDGVVASRAVATLLQVSLVQRGPGGRIRALSPIREYIKDSMMLDEKYFTHLLDHYASICRRCQDLMGAGGRTAVIKLISPQIGNIHSVILEGLSQGSEKLVRTSIYAAIGISYFHKTTFVGSIERLLRGAVNLSRKYSMKDAEAECLLAMSEYLPSQEVDQCFSEALSLFQTLDNKEQLTSALLEYSRSLVTRAKPQEALQTCEQATSNFTSTTPVRIRALGHMHRSRALMSLGTSTEAKDTAKAGLTLINPEEYPEIAINFCGLILSYYGKRSLFPQATNVARLSLSIVKSGTEKGSNLAATLMYLGQCLLIQSRLSEAHNILSQAVQADIEDGKDAYCCLSQNMLGRTLFSLNKLDEAAVIFYTTLQTREMLLGRHQVLRGLTVRYAGRIELSKGNFAAAWAHFEASHFSLKDGQYDLAEVLLAKCDWHLAQIEPTEALPFAIVAAVTCCKHSDRLGVAKSIQRIGDCLYYDDNPSRLSDAKSCWVTSLDFIRFLGVRRHIADCLLRLGIVALLNSENIEAHSQLTQSKQWYAKAEDEIGIKYCDARLQQCDKATEMATSLSEMPPLPLGTFL